MTYELYAPAQKDYVSCVMKTTHRSISRNSQCRIGSESTDCNARKSTMAKKEDVHGRLEASQLVQKKRQP